MGRLLKIILLVVAGFIGLLVIGSVALFLFFEPNDFRDEISTQVKEATGRDLVIEGDLSLSVFPWIAVDIGRTQLGNAKGFGDNPFLSFEEARLSVRLAPLLFQQTVSIGTVTLDSFSLYLEVSANGKNNWDDLAPADEVETTDDAGGAQSLDIAEVRMSDASIFFHDHQAGTTTTITGLSLSTSSILAGEPFEFEAEFDFTTEPAGVSGLMGLSTTMTISEGNEQFSVRDLIVEGDLNGVAAETTEYRLSTPAIDIDLPTDRVTMAKTKLSFLGLDIAADVEPYSYSVMQPKITLVVEPFSLKALFQILGVDAPPTADPEALTQVYFSARAEVGATKVALTSLTLQLDDTKMSGQLSVPLTEQGKYQFDLSADNINLDRYMAPAGAGSSTSAASEDDIEIPVDMIRALQGSGTLRLDRANLSGMTFENMELGVTGANGQLRMYPITADLFEGTYKGDVRINAAGDIPSISVNEKVEGVQLGPLAKAMFDQENITGTIDGSFKLSGSGSNMSSIRRDLHGTMAFSLTDGAWEGTDVWHQLRSAYASFKQRPVPEPRLPARTEFSNVRMSGSVNDGVFYNDDLLAELPFLQMTGNGTVDLAEARVDYSMQARVLEQPEFVDPASDTELNDFTKAVIPLKVTGPLANPSIRPDIEGMLRAEVKRAVEKEGERLKKRLLDKLIGGSEQATDEESDQSQEETEPEDEIKNALKKLFDR